ncbi:MAG: lipoxygenase family protein, partial [Pseudomonadota bacterium]
IFNSEEPDREKYYVTDYSSLKMLEDNDHSAANSEGRKERLVYFPKALFKANNNHLEPVAIQVRRCANGSTESELVLKGAKKWEIAKYIVQNADINYHELVTHLGRTHLYVEAFAVAAGMCLPKDSHPLSILLRPHFEGTININDFATTDLINTSSEIEHGGVFDLNFSGTMESNVKLIAQEAFGISPDGKKDQNFFNKNLFPRDIKRRGFGHFNELKLADHNEAVYILKAYSWKKDKDDLNFSYPYLEDACELWNAITQWVAGYVCVHYTSNAAVLDDCALQAWAKTVVEQGNILGFGEYDEDKKTTVAGEIYTRTYLIQAITSIIFTASVQHAAVNFPQADYGATLPAGIYYDFFKDNNPDITPYLPNKDQFEAVMNVLQLLSSVRYTKLGEYHPNTSDPIPKPEVYFANDTAVCDHLQEFNNRLKEIETMIEKREGADTGKPSEPVNRKYHYLRPSKIPQSINI